MRPIQIILLLIFLGSNCFGQNPVYKHYTVDDGLPGMEVYNVVQDSRGFIWIATSKGVSRFDGSKFENFTIENGLPDNEVLQIHEDTKGRIWFLSLTGKMSFYDGIIHNSSNTSFLQKPEWNQPAITFTPLTTGEIIFSTQNQFTYVLNDTALKLLDTVSNYNVFAKNNHALIMIDRVNALYTEWSGSKLISRIKLNNLSGYDKIVFNKKSNSLIIAKETGLNYFKNNQLVEIANSDFYGNTKIRLFTTDKTGNFWLAASDGCYRFNVDSNNRLTDCKKYFQDFVIDDVFQDAGNNYWFATRGDGLLMVPSFQVSLFNKASGLADNNVTTAVINDDGNILCGTLNGNFHVINNENRIAETINLQSSSVRKIVNDKTGATWIACERNIYKKGDSMKRKQLNPKSVFKTITAVKSGGVLAGCWSQIFKLTDERADTLFIYNGAIRFYAVCETQTGEILAGTEKGVFTLRNNSLIPFHHERKPFTGWIDEMAVTKAGTILITTRDSGLAVVNDDKIDFINTNNGLQSNNCISVFADTLTQIIYLATNKGLSVLKLNSNNVADIKNYSATNGLLCSSIYSVYEKNGDVLLCTDKGLLVLNELNFISDSEIPKVYISKIEINSKDFPLANDYSLSHSENNLRITYSGISFREPKAMLYRYKLMPADTGWNITSSNTIIYTELLSGNYKFTVQVKNESNNWSSTAATFNICIATPFYKKWWFVLLSSLAFLLIVFSVYRYRIKQLQQKHDNENELLQTELKALRSQINPHFIFNSLNSIQDFIFDNQKEAANEYLGKFAKLMRLILDNSSKKYISLNEEISFLKIYLQLESLRFGNKFVFTINVNENVNAEICYLPPMILQLYVENAILHGLAQKQNDGKLLLSFSLADDELICIIEDNGIGRKASAAQKLNSGMKHVSHGLKNTNERIEAINKSSARKIVYEIIDLTDENNIGTGTRVKIIFPQELNSKTEIN